MRDLTEILQQQEKTHSTSVFKTQLQEYSFKMLRNGPVAIIHASISLCSAALLVTEQTCHIKLFFAVNPHTAMEGQGPTPRKSCLCERSLNNHS